MKRIFLSCLFGIFFLVGKSQITGIEPIIYNQAYCVHSEMKIGNTLQNTSNIFVIKGTNDTVWIWSMGYGDPLDLRVYRDCTIINTSLIQDIHYVDSCIKLMNVLNPVLMFIAPHFHLDHINQEFITAIDSIYEIKNSYIYIHVADYSKGTCGCLCCNMPCTQGSNYFGAPYSMTWTDKTISKFRAIGNKNLICGTVIKYITTSYGGWKITKASNIHTSGCINLDCDSLNIRISGSDVNGTCLPGNGWDLLPAHGNIQVDSVYSF